MSSRSPRHWHDTRTRQTRNAQSHAAWEAQMPALVTAYLAYKSDTQMNTELSPAVHEFHVDILGIRGEYAHSNL